MPTMMLKGWVVLSMLLIAACEPKAPGTDNPMLDDLHETYTKKVSVPGQQEPVSVLFGKPDAFVCEGKVENAREILSGLDKAISYKNGYFYFDVMNEVTSYRAYFKKGDMRGSRDATYLFCSGAGSALTGQGCAITGVFAGGCFEASVFSAQSLEEFDQAAIAIKAAAP